MKLSEWKGLSKEERKKVPFKEWPTKMKTALWSVVGLFVMIIMISLGGNDNKNHVTTQVVKNSEWDGSVKQVKDYLKSNLKDWSSYESVEWSPVVADSIDKTYSVRHKYRAKNSFGAYVIENQLFYLDSIGNIFNVINY